VSEGRHRVPEPRGAPAARAARLLPRVHGRHSGRARPRRAARHRRRPGRALLHRRPLRHVPLGRALMDALSEALQKAGWRVFRVDGTAVTGKASFLAACAGAMRFPSWFGGNWDALADCLTDLSWAKASGYLVVLDGMERFAAEAPRDWQTAREILAEAADAWQ